MRGDLNLHSSVGGSISAVLADLETIWGHCISTVLNVPLKDLKVCLCITALLAGKLALFICSMQHLGIIYVAVKTQRCDEQSIVTLMTQLCISQCLSPDNQLTGMKQLEERKFVVSKV